MSQTYTFEEIKKKLNNNKILSKDMNIIYACGKHLITKDLTDKEIKEMVEILNREDTP